MTTLTEQLRALADDLREHRDFHLDHAKPEHADLHARVLSLLEPIFAVAEAAADPIWQPRGPYGKPTPVCRLCRCPIYEGGHAENCAFKALERAAKHA